MTKTIYRCYFEYRGRAYSVDSNPDIPAFNGLQAFADGFWINMDVVILSLDGPVWIPPSRISEVQKLERNND